MTPKEYKQYADLYGFETTVLQAKKDYYFVSLCPKGMPSLGSMTYKTTQITGFIDGCKIKSVVCHKDNGITLKTNTGNFKFWN